MDIQWLTIHIPAGCLKIQLDDSHRALLESSDTSNLQSWKFFTSLQHAFSSQASLPATVQEALLGLPVLQPFIVLWQRRWIQMSFNQVVNSDGVGRVRVYILPHDINRGFIKPTNELIKAISFLVSQLEQAWGHSDGDVTENQIDSTLRDQTNSLAEDDTLLSMFNNVPSPDPRPEFETNLDTRDGMQCLLESRVPGLTTKLYPYQGRSAALMFQREQNPGRIIDPRYKSILDQEGKPWYFDDVSGEVLRGPKYYDGICGGILAEEMGTGKTLICLALILCTQHEPAKIPEPFVAMIPPRKGVASLADMAAAAANKNSVPWKPYFHAYANREYKGCVSALTSKDNQAYYEVSNILVQPRKSSRNAARPAEVKRVFPSSVTLVVVPNNLVKQWQTEINKHTTGLKVLIMVENREIPDIDALLDYDIILFSESRLSSHGLEQIRFKRCIVDEGHKLGSGHRAWKSNTMRVLDGLEIAARWVVTGTPSRGLYGVDQQSATNGTPKESSKEKLRSSLRHEREDLQRIGNLAAKYLKVRPWANTKDEVGEEEVGDRVADWNVYVMHPDQHSRGHNRRDCVKNTLNSLIVRHRRSDISTLLPPVEEKIVLLDGSFQDKLSLNLFSMMIIFNSVQSQRTDVDYFFHERQRKSLIQLVKNLRQACFFGGVFYSVEDINKSLETAEEFLAKKAIPISAEDEDLLKQAISFGKIAVINQLKDISNRFHAMPLYLDGFPGGGGKSWSLDNKQVNGQPICTDSGMIHALQKYLNPCIDAPTSLQLMIESGRLDQQGEAERAQALASAAEASGHATTQVAEAHALAGNTPLGDDRHSKPKSGVLGKAMASLAEGDQGIDAPGGYGEIAQPLENTKIISTVSAKLSYLIDSIVKYQGEEQIIVFYDNDNIAYYLAGVLEILQIEHLIYAKAGLSADRRAQYVATFTHSPKFRVMLMDISQAAFGLDMRSASRIYFISPVLNPQVEAQAIGRARRISQLKPVSVETLVLRNSVEEVIINRRKEMTHAEHSKVKSVLDDRLIYQWILNAKIIPMSNEEDGVAQTTMLETPQFVFGRGFGRELHPDEGLITGSPEAKEKAVKSALPNGNARIPFKMSRSLKRPSPATGDFQGENKGADAQDDRPPKRRARVAFAD
ncbi:SNF2 family N-terminal domain-containing protein [Hypoxylon cercidicola]|nr:SNF2 family N-terminal domain-containing protein [Hypoxylon cercidicola]